MRVYEIKRKEDAPNVFGISLVGTPAMESNYVKLSKENTLELSELEKIELSKSYDIKLKVQDKEKRLLLGLVLEPNKLIYRYDEATKEEYYITVNEETILELVNDYAGKSNQTYSTIEHDGRELDGVTFAQNWVVEDSEIDKSALHGLNLKKGSWATVAKIDNDTLWNDYIKTGVVQGFSIDAMVSLEEVNLNKDNKMSETKKDSNLVKDFIEQVKTALAFEPKEKVEVELAEDEMVEPTATEEPTTEEPTLADLTAKINKIEAVFKEMGVELSATIKDALKPIQEENVALKSQVESLETKVVELSEQPADKKIVSKPTAVNYSEMTNFEKLKYNRENK